MKNNFKSHKSSLTMPIIAFVGTLAIPASAFAAPEPAINAGILMPNLAEFIPALIAFLIIWAIFAKFFWPKVLINLDAREKQIKDDLDQAAKHREDSQEELEAYKAKVAAAEQEAEEILAEAKRHAEQERARIKAKAQQEAQEMIARAHEAIESERKSAMVDAANMVANLSVDIASKLIHENLDVEKQRELIDTYLKEVGSLNAK